MAQAEQRPPGCAFDMMALYGAPDSAEQDPAGCKIYRLRNETGEGALSLYELLPGVRVAYNDIHMAYCNKNQQPAAHVIEINHCREGRYECSVGHQTCCYLSPGDLAIGAVDRQFSDSAFPTRHYHGISIFIEPDALPDALHTLFALLGIDLGHITALVCNENRFFIMRASDSIAHIFSELYQIRENRRSDYLKVKILELLLFLSDLEGADAVNRVEYLNTGLVGKIKQARDFMVADIRRHTTVEALAERFHLSPTALKNGFRKVYGTSVYAYLKAYRLQTAQKRLLCTADPVAGIAAQVGYENPNKFATAFQKAYGASPTAFRNHVRLDR